MSINFRKNKIELDNINLFYKKNKREDNDKSNKIREIILYLILNNNIPEEWYIDERWSSLKDKLIKFINNNFNDLEYSNIKYHYKAGRINNYDYMLEFINSDNSVIKKVYLEFKYNCAKLNDYPQFLSKSANSFIKETDYASFFYNNYLSEIAELYSLEIPDKINYLKYVYNSNYNKHTFFKKLKEDEEKFKKQKKDIVIKSIKDYLENNLELHIDEINKYFQDTQINKTYILYKNGEFYLDKLSIQELTIIDISHINNNNTIVLNTQKNTTKISMLLRWKNHQGILYPAWQISLKR